MANTRFVIIKTALAGAVSNGGTVVLPYPAGTAQADFIGANAAPDHQILVDANDIYQALDSEITVTFGASTITVTNTSSAVWRAGAPVAIMLDQVDPKSVKIGFGSGPIQFATKGYQYVGFTLEAIGGTAPYTFSVQSGSLPSGLSLNGSTGAVSGTPAAAGVSSGVVFRVTDAAGSTADTPPITITVDPAKPLFVPDTGSRDLELPWNRGDPVPPAGFLFWQDDDSSLWVDDEGSLWFDEAFR